MKKTTKKTTIAERRKNRARAARTVTGMMRRKRSAPEGSIKLRMDIAWERRALRKFKEKLANELERNGMTILASRTMETISLIERGIRKMLERDNAMKDEVLG